MALVLVVVDMLLVVLLFLLLQYWPFLAIHSQHGEADLPGASLRDAVAGFLSISNSNMPGRSSLGWGARHVSVMIVPASSWTWLSATISSSF